ncbi:MAG: protein kinase, partial [Pyrinomonadaceae bacterium]
MDRTPQSEWQEIDIIFDDVLDAPESVREKIIRARCGDNEPLAERIRELLHAASSGDDILEDPSLEGIAELDVGPLSHPVGKRIGKYVISSLIGQGGMGAVYLGEREDKEFRQRVAIKLISPIFTDKDNSANFRRERQILAKLNHPSIAALLDGGTTDTGTPYLVMEYVEGVSLTEYIQREDP